MYSAFELCKRQSKYSTFIIFIILNGGVPPACFPHPAHSIKWRCLLSLYIYTPSTHQQMEVSPQPVYCHTQRTAANGGVTAACLYPHLAHSSKWRCLLCLFIITRGTQHEMELLPSHFIPTPSTQHQIEVSTEPVYTHTQHTAPNGGVSPDYLFSHQIHSLKCLFTHTAHSIKWRCLPSLFIRTPSTQHQMEVPPQPVYSHTKHTAPNRCVSPACLFSYPQHSTK